VLDTAVDWQCHKQRFFQRSGDDRRWGVCIYLKIKAVKDFVAIMHHQRVDKHRIAWANSLRGIYHEPNII
jgi:hypothetical protein